MSAVSNSRHACCVTQQKCLLCGPGHGFSKFALCLFGGGLSFLRNEKLPYIYIYTVIYNWVPGARALGSILRILPVPGAHKTLKSKEMFERAVKTNSKKNMFGPDPSFWAFKPRIPGRSPSDPHGILREMQRSQLRARSF